MRHQAYPDVLPLQVIKQLNGVTFGSAFFDAKLVCPLLEEMAFKAMEIESEAGRELLAMFRMRFIRTRFRDQLSPFTERSHYFRWVLEGYNEN